MTNQQAPEIYALHTVPNEGETPWFGIYAVRADAEHDAKVMRDATGRDWSVVRLVVADTATTPAPAADSVTAPAAPSKSLPYEPTSAMLIAARERDPALPIETVRAIYWAMWRKAPTPPTQAADSVLEDAARYRWLRNKSQVVLDRAWFGGMTARNHYGHFLSRDGALAALDAAIDAARKQGGA